MALKNCFKYLPYIPITVQTAYCILHLQAEQAPKSKPSVSRLFQDLSSGIRKLKTSTKMLSLALSAASVSS